MQGLGGRCNLARVSSFGPGRPSTLLLSPNLPGAVPVVRARKGAGGTSDVDDLAFSDRTGSRFPMLDLRP